MFVAGNFVLAFARLLDVIFAIFYWLILIRALISWVNPDPFNPIVQFLQRATDPILNPIRKILPPSGIDFSPIVAFLLLIFLRSFLVATLMDLGYRLR